MTTIPMVNQTDNNNLCGFCVIWSCRYLPEMYFDSKPTRAYEKLGNLKKLKNLYHSILCKPLIIRQIRKENEDGSTLTANLEKHCVQIINNTVLSLEKAVSCIPPFIEKENALRLWQVLRNKKINEAYSINLYRHFVNSLNISKLVFAME